MIVRTRIVATAALGALALFGGLAESASACSCAAEPITARTFHESDGAIIGRLVDVDVQEPPAGEEIVPVGRPADFEYRVIRVFKGRRRITQRIVVRSNSDEAACGLPRQKGRRFGLFLDRRDGRWEGGLCGTTSPREMRRAAERTGFARTSGCGS